MEHLGDKEDIGSIEDGCDEVDSKLQDAWRIIGTLAHRLKHLEAWYQQRGSSGFPKRGIYFHTIVPLDSALPFPAFPPIDDILFDVANGMILFLYSLTSQPIVSCIFFRRRYL